MRITIILRWTLIQFFQLWRHRDKNTLTKLFTSSVFHNSYTNKTLVPMCRKNLNSKSELHGVILYFEPKNKHRFDTINYDAVLYFSRIKIRENMSFYFKNWPLCASQQGLCVKDKTWHTIVCNLIANNNEQNKSMNANNISPSWVATHQHTNVGCN